MDHVLLFDFREYRDLSHFDPYNMPCQFLKSERISKVSYLIGYNHLLGFRAT